MFNIPRLSVDIDLNYIGVVEREKMLADRPKVDQAVGAVFSREGFTVKKVPIEHAGGKWQEMEFLDRILTKGEIEPSLLTTDTDVQDRITRSPMLLWKAVSVRRHFGIGG